MSCVDFDAGRIVGINWKWDHKPGGPFVCDEKTRAVNERWQKGWLAGVKKSRYKSDPKVKALIDSLLV